MLSKKKNELPPKGEPCPNGDSFIYTFYIKNAHRAGWLIPFRTRDCFKVHTLGIVHFCYQYGERRN